jgi:hypothetical protein
MKACKWLILWALFLSIPAFAATPDSGTLSAPATGQSATLTWTGGPFTGATADPSLCTNVTCDTYTLTVNVSSSFYADNPTYAVVVGLDWAASPNDFDLNVYDSAGNLVCSSGTGGSISELADCGQLASGTYTVQAVGFTVVNESYSGHATLGPEVNTAGKARYKSGKFSFSTSQTLPGPDDLLFELQGLEPRVRTDALGNIYAAAIQGLGGGTDTWKSMDGGTSWRYLGQPDGAQAASALARGGGAGGGDEDLAIGNSGNVYVNSLWIGSSTQSTSRDGGLTWSVNPFSSDAPIIDRQWIASNGNNELYLTYKQLGALLVGTETIFVAKSFDGGVTWPQITAMTKPEFGVQPGDQGNIEVDPNNGYVYNVFFDATGHSLYIARSTDGGKSFILKLVYSVQPNTSLVNVFPSLAIDKAGNLFIAFSDSHSAFLTYSRDHATTWSTPVRVSNGSGSKSVIGPWVTAGDAGKVDITWWGSSALSNNDTTAQWKVFFAQSLDAFDKVPVFAQTAATDVMHVGAICTNGTGCADGTRNLAEYFAPGLWTDGSELIVYSDDFHNSLPLATFIRQIGGTTVIGSK